MRFPLFSTLLFICLLATAGSVKADTRYYRLELSWGPYSPDGFTRDVISINGKFPGPLLEATQGDDVEILVVNSMPLNTSVHFHGIEQLRTMWSDGVPGASQRQIQPGETFLYKWHADQYGSYWYHGHSRSQIEDGLLGPILIHPQASEILPFSSIAQDATSLSSITKAFEQSRPVVVGDWNHGPSHEAWEFTKATGAERLCPDSVLINGKGSVNCPTPEELANPSPLAEALLGNQTLTPKGCLPPYFPGGFPSDYAEHIDSYFYNCQNTTGQREEIQVDAADSWASFDFISSAGIHDFSVSIDEHPMWVYAIDGRFIEPSKAHALTIEAGARYSVLIQLDKPSGRQYSIRVNGLIIQVLPGTATLSYAGDKQDYTSVPYINRSGALVSSDLVMLSSTAAVPFPAVTPSKDVDQTVIFDIQRPGTSLYLWTMNGKGVFPEFFGDQEPLLFSPSVANPNITISTKNNTWVDLVFRGKVFNPMHPFHKHSNKAFVIGQGVGEFNYATVAEAVTAMPQNFNLENPPFRDTWVLEVALSEPTWTVVRYQVVNPGPALLHCHMQVHFEGGMGFVMMDGIDAWPEVPDEYLNGNGMLGNEDLSHFISP